MLWLHSFVGGREVDPEVIELSKVIADIYDAAINPALWQQALASICSYVDGYSGVLFWHDAASESSQVLHIYNEDPQYTQLYFAKYLPMNPMFPAATFVDAGIVMNTYDIMPRSEFIETRFYKEWVQPQGMADALAVNLEKGVTRTSLINVRTETPVNDVMRARMALVVPHLQRAIAIGRLFDQHEATEQAFTATLDHVEAAVFLVGADGAIAFVNAPAAKMLDDAVLVRRDGQALRAVAAETDRMLRDIFTSAAKGRYVGRRARHRDPPDHIRRGALVRACPAVDLEPSSASRADRPRGRRRVHSQHHTERAAAARGSRQALQTDRRRGARARRPVEDGRRQGDGGCAWDLRRHGANASAQPVPQDRHQGAKRSGQARRRHLTHNPHAHLSIKWWRQDSHSAREKSSREPLSTNWWIDLSRLKRANTTRWQEARVTTRSSRRLIGKARGFPCTSFQRKFAAFGRHISVRQFSRHCSPARRW